MRIITKLRLVLIATLALIGRAWGAPTLAGYTICSNSSILTCHTTDSLPANWAWQAGDVFVALADTTGSSNPAATCNTTGGWTLIGHVVGLGSGNSNVTVCEKFASSEGATENPISAIGSGNTSWGGQMLDIRSGGTISFDQFVGTQGNGLSGGSQQFNNASTTQPDELALFVYSGNANDISISGSGLTSVASQNSLAIATYVQPTAGLLPIATAAGSQTGGNSQGEILTFYATGTSTPTPSATPTPAPTGTATPTSVPTPTSTPAPTSTPSPTPTPVLQTCINPSVTIRGYSLNNAPATAISLNSPVTQFGDLELIYLLSSDVSPIIPNALGNLGLPLGTTIPWQHVYGLQEPSPIANNIWTYAPGTNEPAFVTVNSPTAEAEDFIAAVDLQPNCGTFHNGEFGSSAGTTNVSSSLASPRVVTSHYGEMCVVFAADDFAGNQVSFANTPPGFVTIPGTPAPVAIGYFPMTIPGVVPSFNLNSTGTSGTLVMQVVCPWAN